MGSAGAQTFPGLRRLVIEQAQTRVYAYLHIAVEGMISSLVGELEDIRWASVEQCVQVAEANRDTIAGVKLRAGYQMVGPDPRAAVGLALEAADALGLPLMVHVIDMGMPLPELLAQMRPGDVVTHCFHGNEGSLLDASGNVWPEAFEARERGILFDVGHGVGSFTWRVARAALAQGFPPDTISSDIHAYNHAGPGARPAAHALEAPPPRHAAARRDRRRHRARRRAPRARRARRAGDARSGRAGRSQPARAPERALRARRRRAPPLGGRHRVRGGTARRAQRRARGCRRGVRRAHVTALRIAGGRVVAPGGVLDGADVLVEDGRRRRRRRCGCRPAPASWTRAAATCCRADSTRTRTSTRACATRRRAALRSGTTAVEAYAPPAPGERVEDACARWRALAAGSACRIEPLATVYEPDALDEASFAALAEQGVRGIKLFLAYRELGMDADDELLVRALLWGREHGVVPRLHCENAGAIQVLRERLRAAGDLGVDAHPRSRPPLVEEEGIRRALDLARLAEAPVYIVHVSTAGGVAAIRRARAEGVDVTGETCPQYLLLDDSVYAGPLAADGRDLAAAASARARRGRLGGRAGRHADRHRLRSLAPRLAARRAVRRARLGRPRRGGAHAADADREPARRAAADRAGHASALRRAGRRGRACPPIC